MARNLYRIDDVLLRVGAVTGFGLIAATLATVLAALAAGPDGAGVGALLGRHAPWLLLPALGPIGLLAAGVSMRRRERRIGAIWNLLRRNAELSVSALLAHSDFERRDLERAVRFLNNRGLGHYVWVRETDTIQDARLRSSHVQVDECKSCGASLSLRVPIGGRGAPRCPHCRGPVRVDALQERRDELLETLREEAGPASSAFGERVAPSRSFSPAVFLLLLVVFWPAALGYAWLTWQGRP